MPNEFVAKNGLISQNNVIVSGSVNISGSSGTLLTSNTDTLEITGSLLVTGSATFTGSVRFSSGLTGSLLGTASYASNSDLLDNRDSSTFASTGSNTFNGNQTITGSLNVSSNITTPGTITATTLVVQTVTSSVSFITGSTKFGVLSSNTHQFTGSVSTSGSLAVNGSVLYADGTSVGIGTTSPAGILQIKAGNPAVYITCDDTGQSHIYFGGTSDNDAGRITYSDNVDAMWFTTDNTERVRITNSGSVLIGTTSAISGNSRMQLLVGGNANGSTLALGNSGDPNKFVIESDSGENAIINNRANTPMIFYTSGSRRMDIAANGNVGIGTASPAYKLDVIVSTNTDAIRVQQGGSSKVLLTGDGVVAWGASANAGVLTWDTGFARVNAESTNDLRLTTSGGGILIVKSGGNVGVGTTAPTSRLEVKAPDTGATTNYASKNIIANSPLVGGYTGAPIVSMLAMYDDSIHGADIGYLYDAAGYGLVFSVNDNTVGNPIEALRINRSGNVGIGTTNPGAKLQVAGNIDTTGNVSAASISYSGVVTSGGLGARLWVPGQAIGQTTYAGLYGMALTYLAKYESGWKSVGGGYASAITIDEGAFSFSNSQGVGAADSSLTWTTRLMVDATGNVGIGTTSPGNRLTVKSAGTSSFSLGVTNQNNNLIGGIYETSGNAGQLYLYTNTTENVKISSIDTSYFNGGSVGIGTTNPIERLHVFAGNGDGIATGKNATNAEESANFFLYPSSNSAAKRNWAISTYYSAPGRLDFVRSTATTNDPYWTGSSVMTLDGVNDRVGIGTTAPKDTLDVFGSIVIRSTYNLSWGNTYGAGVPTITGGSGSAAYLAFYPAGSTSSEKVRITADGNVGIGTVSPTSQLSVFGTAAQNGISIKSAGNGGTFPFRVTWASGGEGDMLLVDDDGRTRLNNASVPTVGGFVNTTLAIKQKVDGGSGGGLHIEQASNTNVAFFGFTGTAFRIGTSYRSTGAYTPIEFTTNAATRLYIETDGNVGISTTTPRVKLSIDAGNVSGIAELVNLHNQSQNNLDGTRLTFSGYGDTSTYPTWRFAGITGLYDTTSGGINAGGWGGQLRFFVNRGNTATAFEDVMTITGGGRVGIGTVNPASELDIAAVASSDTVSGLIVSGSGWGSIGNAMVRFDGGPSSDGNILLLRSSGNNRSDAEIFEVQNSGSSTCFVIKGNGNVGIGTSSPGVALDVAGSIRSSNVINWNGGVGALSWDTGLVTMETNTSTAIQLKTNGSTRIHIAAGGSVGIGTTAPTSSYTMTVEGISADSPNILYLKRQGSPQGLFIKAGGGVTTYNSYEGNNVVYGAHVWESTKGTDTVERMRIAGSGNVGIGTTSPTALLHVSGTIGGIFEVDGASAVTALYVSSSGNVGIGTSVPLATLHVLGSDAGFRITGTSRAQMLLTNATSQWQIESPTGASNVPAGAFGIIESGIGSRFTILTGGNIGIGTTSPAARLHVQTASTALQLRLANTNGTNWDFYSYNDNNFYINNSSGTQFTILNSSGNVGIGTVNPQYRLHVQDSTTTGTIAIGHNLYPGLIYSNASDGEFRIDNRSSTSGYISFYPNGQTTVGNERMRITAAGTVQPGANGTQDLGSSSLRWATVFTSDLDMSNGIGDYTIVEGEEDLFLYNNKTNKVFKFLIQEVDPSTAPPKKVK